MSSREQAIGRFTEPVMTAAMRQVADRLGVPSDDARLLRLTNNAVYALPAAGLVIRLARSHGLYERVHKVVRLAGWFADVDAPTIRLASHIQQPVPAADLLATVWHYLPPTPPTPTVNDLGHVLHQFHHLPAPPIPLPCWDPIGDARTRILDAEALPDNDQAFLLDWCDRLTPAITDLTTRHAPRLVHGDAHTGNLLRDQDGRVVLCDFDPTSLGPWQVDLVAVPVGEIRFRRRGAHHTLATAYGYDVTTDPHWPLLKQARELKMIAAAVPLLASRPGVADEFHTRLNSVINHDDHARWTPFADLPR